MKRLLIPALALLLSLPAQADTLWGYNQGSSQVLGFASSSGSVTDVRWLGDPAANNFGYFSSLNLDAQGVRLGCEMAEPARDSLRNLQTYIDQTQKRRRLMVLS